MSRPKELRVFARRDWRDALDWYRTHFDPAADVRGESAPPYSAFPLVPADLPARIAAVIPDARLIYVVRDPIDRLVAHYVETLARRFETRSLDETLRDYESERNVLVMTSRYSLQLDRFREHFAESQILVLDHRDLLERRAETLREVFAFLGIDTSFTAPEFEAVHNTRDDKRRLTRVGLALDRRGVLRRVREPTRVLPGAVRESLKRAVTEPVRSTRPDLDPRVASELRGFLREDADRLRRTTGRAFATWSV